MATATRTDKLKAAHEKLTDAVCGIGWRDTERAAG